MAIGHGIFDMPKLTTLLQKELQNDNFEDRNHSRNLTKSRLKHATSVFFFLRQLALATILCHAFQGKTERQESPDFKAP